MTRQIRNQVVAITGASSGIGRATALLFAAQGARLILIARRKRELQDLAEECLQRGGEAQVAAVDVGDEAALQQAVSEAAAAYGRIDVWINNAGVMLVGKFLDCPPEIYRRLIETNLFGYIHGARAALPLFKLQGSGMLINVASTAGKVGTPYQSAYNASKFAIVGWSESLRMELFLEKARNIHVCTILPYSTDTPLFHHAANYTGRGLKPARPLYTPERVAGAILRTVLFPRPETVVGAAARVALLAHALAPEFTGKLVAKAVEKDHFQDHLTPATAGNTLEPLAAHSTTTGGWREPADKQQDELGSESTFVGNGKALST